MHKNVDKIRSFSVHLGNAHQISGHVMGIMTDPWSNETEEAFQGHMN